MMVALDGIVATQIISKIWIVLAGSSQTSMDYMKVGANNTNKSVKTVLQSVQKYIIREAVWVTINNSD